MNQEAATYFENMIRVEAAEAHIAFPQYAGHYAGPEWKLYVVQKTIRTKMGTAFLRGEVVLAKEETLPELGPRIVAYSRSNKIDTVLQHKFVRAYAVR